MNARVWLLRASLLAVSLLVGLALGEAGLRIVGFRYSLAPERVEFGWPNPEVRRNLYRPDPELFWVPKDYAQRLARLRSERLGIAFLGDSCTEFGSYPERLLAALRAARPGLDPSGVALGVGGWSSWQGRQQMRRDVAPHAPALVTLYFGWNDHWIGFGVDDRSIAEIGGAIPSWLRRLRIAGALERAAVAWRARSRAGVRPARVSPADFAANLRDMVARARRAGSVPVVLTAPTSHRRGAEPAYLGSRWLEDLSQLVPLHEQYAEIARGVARAQGVPLCDLHAAFAALPRTFTPGEYFQRDGIHLTPAGDERLAELLANCLLASPAARGALGL